MPSNSASFGFSAKILYHPITCKSWKPLLNHVSVIFTDLIFVPSEAAAFHGAGVEVALVVKLEAGQTRVQLVEDGWQAAAQRQQLGACAVEANTHGTLQ